METNTSKDKDKDTLLFQSYKQELNYKSNIISLFENNNNDLNKNLYLNYKQRVIKANEMINKNIKTKNETLKKLVPLCIDNCVPAVKVENNVNIYPNFNNSLSKECIEDCLLKGKYVYDNLINMKDIY